MIAGGLAGALVMLTALVLMSAFATRHRRHEHLARRDMDGTAVPIWFAQRVDRSEQGHDAGRLWVLWLGGLPLAAFVGMWIGGIGCAALTIATWAAAPLLLPGHLARRAAAKREEAVPQVLDAIARALRSGASLLQALGEAAAEEGPLQSELRRVVSEAERGAGVATALNAWADRQPSGSIRLAAAALSLGAETGGANARAVEGVASTVRQRLAVAGEAKALSAQPRVSAQVIGLAPIAFAAFSAATDPELARLLFTTPLGWAMLGTGLALDLAGMRWMMRMAKTS
ncbi:MAG TPA: type II secretion system F family protein [Acidimicrobiales bacterium]|nr:type II secretion system F family protein [Acidimicrobiales bacterium]